MSSILRTFPESARKNLADRSDYGVSEIQEVRTDRVASLLKETPSIKVLAQLIEIDPNTLGRTARIDYLAALERQSSWLQAAMQRAIVAVAGEEPSVADDLWKGIDDSEREDVASALRLSGSTAQMRIDVARTLVNHLPNTCSALASGEISPAHATVIARETASAIRDGLSSLAIFTVEQRALAHAEFHTPAQVANKVRTTLARIAPEEFEDAALTAHDTRRVSCYREADGMSTIVAILPALDAQFVMSAIESIVFETSSPDCSPLGADKSKNDMRTMEMKRADALSELAQRYFESAKVSGDLVGGDDSTEGMPPVNSRVDSAIRIAPLLSREDLAQRISPIKSTVNSTESISLINSRGGSTKGSSTGVRRRPITVNVTIDLPTLLGLAENPGQLSGYGAIPASLARELASNSQWRRFITDPHTGALLDYGRETYEPPKPLVDFLLARDRTCRFPGCRAPARLADLDHAHSWESGGETSAQNLGALCRRHHRLKTHGGWKLESDSDGSCTWTSPDGKQYHVPARDINETV